ncbi:14817_t:CDS:1, partial [Cetraspora pellucida]
MFKILEVNSTDFTVKAYKVPHLDHIYELKFFLNNNEEIDLIYDIIGKPDNVLIYDNNKNIINHYCHKILIEDKKNHQIYCNDLLLFNINSQINNLTTMLTYKKIGKLINQVANENKEKENTIKKFDKETLQHQYDALIECFDNNFKILEQ